MGMVDVAKNLKSTMEDLKKPRPHGLSCSSSTSSSPKSSLSPWAWKASLFLWRRLVKDPKHPHVIKPSTNASSNWGPCKRANKSVSIPFKSCTNYTTSNFFYYSDPNHNPNDTMTLVVPDGVYEYCDVVKTKARSRPSNGYCNPTTCDHTADLINMEYDNTLPYFQLRPQRVPLPGSMGRLPLYNVS